MHVILDEKSDIRISSEKPEKFGYDSFPVYFFCREERESIRKIESKLSSKKTIRHIATSEVFIIDSVLDQFTTEIEVLLFWMIRHGKKDRGSKEQKELWYKEVYSEVHDFQFL